MIKRIRSSLERGIDFPHYCTYGLSKSSRFIFKSIVITYMAVVDSTIDRSVIRRSSVYYVLVLQRATFLFLFPPPYTICFYGSRCTERLNCAVGHPYLGDQLSFRTSINLQTPLFVVSSAQSFRIAYYDSMTPLPSGGILASKTPCRSSTLLTPRHFILLPFLLRFASSHA